MAKKTDDIEKEVKSLKAESFHLKGVVKIKVAQLKENSFGKPEMKKIIKLLKCRNSYYIVPDRSSNLEHLFSISSFSFACKTFAGSHTLMIINTSY